MVIADATLEERVLENFLFLFFLLWLFDLVVLEEVDEISLVRLEYLLAGKVVHAQLLDDLEDVKLLAKLALCALEQEVSTFLFGPAATADRLVEAPQVPESSILVCEGLSLLDLLLHLVPILVVLDIRRGLVHLLGQFKRCFSPQLIHGFQVVMLLVVVFFLD